MDHEYGLTFEKAVLAKSHKLIHVIYAISIASNCALCRSETALSKICLAQKTEHLYRHRWKSIGLRKISKAMILNHRSTFQRLGRMHGVAEQTGAKRHKICTNILRFPSF
jgi:hypothetical protein